MSATGHVSRDLALPEAAGDPALSLSEAGVHELVRRTLLRDGAPAIERVELGYARWKPQVSITTTYGVRFEDGAETSVTLKTYLEGKDRHVAEHFAADRHFETTQTRLAPFAVVGSTCLWAFPAERVLRGLSRAMDKRRTARMIDSTGVFSPFVVRLRPTRLQLLRYKPERRAVFRLDAKLRGKDGERDERRLALRVLTPRAIEGVLERRRACEGGTPSSLLPGLVHAEPASGILLEEWLEGLPVGPLDFSHGELGGRALAALHARRVDAPSRPDPRAWRALEPLFAVDAALLATFSSLTPPPRLQPRVWVHGDFHPDQLVLRDGDARLVDLDALRPGDPVDDLSSWIADHVAQDPDLPLREASGPLVAGYRAAGAPAPDERELALAVGSELVERAAAAIRRLEKGAVRRAKHLLDLAVEIAPGLRRSR